MLNNLDTINWRQLMHTYGPADDIPELIRNLASPSRDIWEKALEKRKLSSFLIHLACPIERNYKSCFYCPLNTPGGCMLVSPLLSAASVYRLSTLLSTSTSEDTILDEFKEFSVEEQIHMLRFLYERADISRVYRDYLECVRFGSTRR